MNPALPGHGPSNHFSASAAATQGGDAAGSVNGKTGGGPRLLLHGGLFLLALAVVVLVLRLLAPGAYRASFTREPTRYTALSFADPDRLASGPRDTPTLSFGFILTNKEAQRENYSYVVRIVTAGRDTPVEQGFISVGIGATVTKHVTLSGLPTKQKYSIVVALPGRPESINLLRS